MYSLRGQDNARGGRQIAYDGVGMKVALFACARCRRMLHEDRPAPGRAPGLDIPVGVADHPRASEVEAQVRRGGEQHPGRGLAAIALPGQLRNHALGMVEAESEIVEARAFRGQQLQDPSLDRVQLSER